MRTNVCALVNANMSTHLDTATCKHGDDWFNISDSFVSGCSKDIVKTLVSDGPPIYRRAIIRTCLYN